MRSAAQAATEEGTRARAALAGGLALLSLAACGKEGGEAPVDPVELQKRDPRLAELLEPCVTGGFYDRDTSDPVGFLIEKLERGQPEVLKRAKQELGELGEEAMDELERFFDRNYADAMHSPYVENAVDAAAFNLTPRAHGLLLRALVHPQESIRRGAVLGLKTRHAKPEDFELLVERFRGLETLEIRRALVGALFTADAERAEALFLDSFERGEDREMWPLAGPYFAASEHEATARRSAALFEQVGPELGVHLAACAARGGDARARAWLTDELGNEDRQRRLSAVTALSQAELRELLERPLLEDPDDQVRALAAAGIALAPELSDAQRGALRSALDDPSPVVQVAALKILCGAGDADALDRALSLLSGDPGPLQAALQALVQPMTRDPALARRAFERLLERHTLEEHRPVQQRTATFKAIGLVPLVEAAAFLRSAGIAADAEKIEGLRGHEWLMIHAANTGTPGRAYLADELAREDDPLRRLDLIDAVGSVRDDLARERLQSFVEGGLRNEYETLFAASRLVKAGPSWDVAPVLKRVSYSMKDTEPRVALQCLLWFWY